MRDLLTILALIFSVTRMEAKKISRLKIRGAIGQKNISLPAEMISEMMIASNNTNLSFADMLHAFQYPIDYKSKHYLANQRKQMEDENDTIEGSAEESKKYKDLGKIDKLGKSLGVESRWRYRLTNCQRSQTCECGERHVIPPSPFGTEGSFVSQEGKFYGRNSNCIWTVSAPPDHTILMRFKQFAIEREDVCGFDYAMIFSGKMAYLNQPNHNLTVHSHGVFCGSIKFPQNVGDDDWADKTVLIPTSDSGDGSLNRTFFSGQWTDLRSENAGVIFVSDSDTQHTGFELQYRVVPVMQEGVNISTTEQLVDYVWKKILDHVRTNPLNTEEQVIEKEIQVNKTMTRILKATNKSCYDLTNDLVPEKIQDGVKQTNTATGYFPFLMDLIIVTHKDCRTRHRYAWRKRFNKLTKFLILKTANAGDSTVNQSDLSVIPAIPGNKETEEETVESEIVEDSPEDYPDSSL